LGLTLGVTGLVALKLICRPTPFPQTRTSRRAEICASFRPGLVSDPIEATSRSLRCLARRHRGLSTEIDELDEAIAALCAQVNPALLGARGVGA
jgi:hypothetical protein